MIQLLIADHAPTRQALRVLLDDDLEVCAEAADGSAAIAAAERTQPDVCIIGAEIAGGLTAVQGIGAVAPGAKVVVLAADPNPDEMLTSIKLGAVGYVAASTSPEAFSRIVRGAAAGEAAIARSMVAELARELRQVAAGDQLLTPREAQVRSLLREGRSTAAIAEQLQISPITVRRHVSILMRKSGVSSRAAV